MYSRRKYIFTLACYLEVYQSYYAPSVCKWHPISDGALRMLIGSLRPAFHLEPPWGKFKAVTLIRQGPEAHLQQNEITEVIF